jgi:hypothetical protein
MSNAAAKTQNLHPRVIFYAKHFGIPADQFYRFLQRKEQIPGLKERFRQLRRLESDPIPLKILLAQQKSHENPRKNSTKKPISG